MSSEYNGWKNYSTWNVALWINNDESLYRQACEYIESYKGNKPYVSFIRWAGLDKEKTQDNIQFVSRLLDYEALNEMMKELTE